jgi:superoxide dismutase, Cu-Zn family
VKRIAIVAVGTALALAPVAFAQQTKPAAGKGPARAEATIESRSGSTVKGHAEFTQVAGKVKLSIHIEGATPGTHAVHLHEKGDCSDPEGKSAGGHWNPSSQDHGKWGTAPFHHGDIGNIEVGPDGKGSITLDTDLWSVGGDPSKDVVGKAVIVHAAADDFKTQPTGNAGGRVGCGVVQAEKK